MPTGVDKTHKILYGINESVTSGHHKQPDATQRTRHQNSTDTSEKRFKTQKIPEPHGGSGIFTWFSDSFPSILWSWMESNPRPNRETIRFLHAYSGLRFSSRDKTRTTDRDLIPKNFTTPTGHDEAISDLTAPLYQRASEQQLLSDVSSLYLVAG